MTDPTPTTCPPSAPRCAACADLGAEDCAGLRRQALAWLRADLTALAWAAADGAPRRCPPGGGGPAALAAGPRPGQRPRRVGTREAAGGRAGRVAGAVVRGRQAAAP